MSELTTEKTNIKTHKDLDVWKKSMDLVEGVYLRTDSFPDSEKYGLTNQIRRCAVSVSSNIAERLKYSQNIDILENVVEIRRMLLGLIKYLKSKQSK